MSVVTYTPPYWMPRFIDEERKTYPPPNSKDEVFIIFYRDVSKKYKYWKTRRDYSYITRLSSTPMRSSTTIYVIGAVTPNEYRNIQNDLTNDKLWSLRELATMFKMSIKITMTA